MVSIEMKVFGAVPQNNTSSQSTGLLNVWMIPSKDLEDVRKYFFSSLILFSLSDLFFQLVYLFHTCKLWYHLSYHLVPFWIGRNTHAHAHIHKYAYTSRNRGRSSLTESLSPHVDNVTSSVFLYLVLTIKQHLAFVVPVTLSLSLFWDQYDVEKKTVILCNCNS